MKSTKPELKPEPALVTKPLIEYPIHFLLDMAYQLEVRKSRHEILMGMIFLNIQEFQRWKEIGDHLHNFEDFIQEISDKFSRTTIYQYMGLAKKFGDIAELDVGVTKLDAIKGVVTKENRDEWVEKAKVLPMRALKDEVREAKGKIPTDGCDHAEKELWQRCVACGKWIPMVPEI